MKKLYVVLAQTTWAYFNCGIDKNTEWKLRHEERLIKLVKEQMPSGSGIDDGVKLDLDKSTSEKLVFTTSFHHMNGTGYYVGCWTDHTITVTASLIFGINIRISGRNRNDIKDYLHDVFHEALTKEIED
jgi:hypothetical protein